MTPSRVPMSRQWAASTFAGTRRRSKRCVRDRIVAGTLCGSVVAKTKSTWPGGSSTVLRKAFQACGESMWHSSTM